MKKHGEIIKQPFIELIIGTILVANILKEKMKEHILILLPNY